MNPNLVTVRELLSLRHPIDSEVAVHGPNAADDASLGADALIIGSRHEPHWTDCARNFLEALMNVTPTLED